MSSRGDVVFCYEIIGLPHIKISILCQLPNQLISAIGARHDNVQDHINILLVIDLSNFPKVPITTRKHEVVQSTKVVVIVIHMDPLTIIEFNFPPISNFPTQVLMPPKELSNNCITFRGIGLGKPSMLHMVIQNQRGIPSLSVGPVYESSKTSDPLFLLSIAKLDDLSICSPVAITQLVALNLSLIALAFHFLVGVANLLIEVSKEHISGYKLPRESDQTQLLVWPQLQYLGSFEAIPSYQNSYQLFPILSLPLACKVFESFNYRSLPHTPTVPTEDDHGDLGGCSGTTSPKPLKQEANKSVTSAISALCMICYVPSFSPSSIGLIFLFCTSIVSSTSSRTTAFLFRGFFVVIVRFLRACPLFRITLFLTVPSSIPFCCCNFLYLNLLLGFNFRVDNDVVSLTCCMKSKRGGSIVIVPTVLLSLIFPSCCVGVLALVLLDSPTSKLELVRAGMGLDPQILELFRPPLANLKLFEIGLDKIAPPIFLILDLAMLDLLGSAFFALMGIHIPLCIHWNPWVKIELRWISSAWSILVPIPGVQSSDIGCSSVWLEPKSLCLRSEVSLLYHRSKLITILLLNPLLLSIKCEIHLFPAPVAFMRKMSYSPTPSTPLENPFITALDPKVFPCISSKDDPHQQRGRPIEGLPVLTKTNEAFSPEGSICLKKRRVK
ncbi:putative ribonuclease H protein [Senna tora]|uniref:Putative ribonuclease H protein n=1 Tax=Senna tora TaxID=362788 RepID=A0A834TMN1_9FABA|nr:putative ribonuclease H protein [Senna tora]